MLSRWRTVHSHESHRSPQIHSVTRESAGPQSDASAAFTPNQPDHASPRASPGTDPARSPRPHPGRPLRAAHALCRGKVDLTCDGRRLYAGLVLPGMMRLMSPGEQVRQVVYTASEAIALDIPGPHLRAAGGPAPAAPARRALLDQPPCCGASSRSNGLAAWPWTPNAWTRCTPNSSWTA